MSLYKNLIHFLDSVLQICVYNPLILRICGQHSNEILFQPLIIYVSNSIEKNQIYYRNILENYIVNEHIEEGEEFDKLNLSSFLYDENINNFINRLINEL